MLRLKTWQSLLIVDAILVVYIYFFIMPRLAYSPPSFSLDKFPLVAQPDGITCGPTSATMLLKYYGYQADVESLREKAKTTWFNYRGKAVGMTLPGRLESALEQCGLDCRMMHAELRQIKYYLSRGRPPIVLLRSGKKTWHYVVVVGYTPNKVTIADPADASIWAMSDVKFISAWSFSGDMAGNEHGHDVYRFLVMMGGVYPSTCIIPRHPKGDT